ncbi:MAG TPA: CHAT domain-containing protein [Blastocatellia bacterium]|nr:CHAT domain-containing protein [Blastocatellia bacterium]
MRRRGPVTAARKQWAFFFYLCGDNHLAADIEDDCEEICRVGSSPDVHVVVQHDRPDGARRYLLPEGRRQCPEPTMHLGRINTGEPKVAVDFLLWGIEHAPADHIAVVFGSPGINPYYLLENLPGRGWNRKESELATWVERHLFSICHDKTSNDALEAWELRTILDEVVTSLNRPIDLVGLDMGASAFVEIAYQMEGLARVLVASQRFVPDDGWPYRHILTGWQKCLARTPTTVHDLAKLIIQMVADRYAQSYPEGDVRVAAIDLMALANFARGFDALTMALLQSLGDWHVLDACRRAALSLEWIHAVSPKERMHHAWRLGDRLPAVDVLELLESLSRELHRKLTEAPRDYGQRERAGQLAALAEKSLTMFTRGTPSNRSVLIAAWPRSDRGLSIVFPPLRPPEEIEAETGPRFHLAHSNYLDLNFSRQVHWAAFIGALQLIQEKPHVLWRLVSSMLADATGPAREALMQRLLSPDSVLEGLKRQFQSLGPHRALTLSVDTQVNEADADRQMFRLRLESTVAGAVVAEHESRIYRPALDETVNTLEQLLATVDENPNVLDDLESLGRTLGEDVLQDLADRLEAERKEAINEGEFPHLRLQIPRELMRYPWELMSDGRGLICERYAVGRQVFMEASRARRITRRRPGPIEVLVIGNPPLAPEFQTRWEKRFGFVPSSLPGAEHEAHLVAEAFERLNDELAGIPPVRVTRVIGRRLTGNDFRRLLRRGRYDIVHYAGHARFDGRDPEASAWLLSDGVIRAREIRNTLAWTASPPWLVFASACEAAQEAGRIVARYQGEVFGLATAFINQGVAAYIAPLWKLDDEVATHVAIDFYRGLIFDRLSLGEALGRARLRARLRWTSPPRAVASWASLVLYGDPTPRLLESLWTPHAAGEKEATAE